jgi:cobalt/nickel transport system permease protein
LHHLVVDEWTRRPGWLQCRDPRAKLIVLLAFLVCVGTFRKLSVPAALALGGLVAAGVILGKLPARGVAARALLVAPFAGPLAVASALSGQTGQAISLLMRALLSAAAVVVIVGATPMPRLLRGMEWLGAPRFFVLIVQFLYRYLFLLSEQAQHMRLAALSRGIGPRHAGIRRVLWRAAGGAIGVLFVRSHARAAAIHRAMLARGFRGSLVPLAELRMRLADWVFLVAGMTLSAAIRLGVRSGS